MAETLLIFDVGIRVRYMHSDVQTLERMEIVRDLRLGAFDVLVGINLLREGLDLPEVSLVCILDADKEGYLRSETSLIQTVGRAARNVKGRVIMYADSVTGSMRRAIHETERRRKKQEEHNKKHGITPATVEKAVRDIIQSQTPVKSQGKEYWAGTDIKDIPRKAIPQLVAQMKREMKQASRDLEFERAALLRDMIFELEDRLGQKRQARSS